MPAFTGDAIVSTDRSARSQSNSRRAVLSPRCIDSFVSTYDKWLFLTKSMMKTIKVDQNNIAASDEYGDMPEENEEELQPL